MVYSIMFNKYSRPIETPIHNLRPASETCKRCHWPEKFYDRKIRSKDRTLATRKIRNGHTTYDETSTIYNTFGLQEGIHWHFDSDVRIEYMARSKDLESLPWV